MELVRGRPAAEAMTSVPCRLEGRVTSQMSSMSVVRYSSSSSSSSGLSILPINHLSHEIFLTVQYSYITVYHKTHKTVFALLTVDYRIIASNYDIICPMISDLLLRILGSKRIFCMYTCTLYSHLFFKHLMADCICNTLLVSRNLTAQTGCPHLKTNTSRY
jgi:hypothetical protein